MSEEHAPLPWKWHPESKDQAHAGAVYSEQREGHAYAIAMQPQYQSDARWREDAALIVRSVNALPALVKALEEIAAFDDLLANERLATNGSYSSFDEPGSVQIARAALAAYRSNADE